METPQEEQEETHRRVRAEILDQVRTGIGQNNVAHTIGWGLTLLTLAVENLTLVEKKRLALEEMMAGLEVLK